MSTTSRTSSTTTADTAGNTVCSDPATVVIYIVDPGCNQADLSAPYGELKFFDVSSFLTVFGAGCP